MQMARTRSTWSALGRVFGIEPPVASSGSHGASMTRKRLSIQRVQWAPTTAKFRSPKDLQASTDVGGPARAEWLAALPDRVEELCSRWGRDLGAPFEPGGN